MTVSRLCGRSLDAQSISNTERTILLSPVVMAATTRLLRRWPALPTLVACCRRRRALPARRTAMTATVTMTMSMRCGPRLQMSQIGCSLVAETVQMLFRCIGSTYARPDEALEHWVDGKPAKCPVDDVPFGAGRWRCSWRRTSCRWTTPATSCRRCTSTSMTPRFVLDLQLRTPYLRALLARVMHVSQIHAAGCLLCACCAGSAAAFAIRFIPMHPQPARL